MDRVLYQPPRGLQEIQASSNTSATISRDTWRLTNLGPKELRRVHSINSVVKPRPEMGVQSVNSPHYLTYEDHASQKTHEAETQI